MDPNPPAIELTDAIVSLRPDWEPEAVGRFEYLSGGYSNDNYSFYYRDRRFVLRCPGHSLTS